MDSPNDIRQIADTKLQDAQVLLSNNRYENAYYLAGYAVELYLKAKIAERFQCDSLFSEGFNNANSQSRLSVFFKSSAGATIVPNSYEVDEIIKHFRKIIKTHNYSILLRWSNLKTNLDDQTDPNNSNFNSQLKLDWANIKKWNESTRYLSSQQQDVNQFIQSVNNFSLWINSQP